MASEATIASIFYARFHDEHGPKVLHQVPEGSIIPCPPSPTSIKEPFFDFQSISSYLIPNREFCNRSLSVCSNGYRILGHPVCITDEAKYERNDFIFNFCIVIDEKADWTSLKGVVTKLAKVFGNLEEQGGFLSKEEEDGTVLVAGTEGYGGDRGSKVFAVVEMVFEDLKAVGETMIPIDESNTLNLSLFPTRPQPPPIHKHHVPLSVVRFTSLQTSAWDLTMQRIIPHINGINSVHRISQLADTDLSLTRRAIQHLVYYDCVLLLDIFSFSAIYAPTPEIATFISSPAMQDECRRYVASRTSPFGLTTDELAALINDPSKTSLPTDQTKPHPLRQQHRAPRTSTSSHPSNPSATSQHPTTTTTAGDADADATLPTRTHLISLYTSLRQAQSLRDYCLARPAALRGIDVRRLITFGVIKGFLYRVHRYALLPGGRTSAAAPLAQRTTGAEYGGEAPGQRKGKALVPGAGVPLSLPGSVGGVGDAEVGRGVQTGWTGEVGIGNKKLRRRNVDDLDEAQEDHEVGWRVAALSSGWRLPDGPEGMEAEGNGGGPMREEKGGDEGAERDEGSLATTAAKRKADREVLRFADGRRCFDEICTELKMVERDAMERLRAAGDVVFFSR